MRLHRLHFSSKLWPRTFAMSWPHSQRVSEASDAACDEELLIIKPTSLILRTIIKIVSSLIEPPLAVNRNFQGLSKAYPPYSFT